eukprot:TRINITY_DN20183_c0_g1_i1.p1 TRINITY_DN20183_c0_g1~~TRINITY_DN20183_c0_g1_i1.p1  ORF type:complete len:422 (+),score=71.76 TRINITY_DN20183_c0_g1_i1:54-1268(+)
MSHTTTVTETKEEAIALRPKYADATNAVHAGQSPDPITGAIIFPISMSTTFQQASPGVHRGFEYSRTGNPTRNAFEANVAAAEHAKHGIAFASGSAACMTIIHLLRKGDHVVAMDDCYGGTYRYFTKIATPMGIDFTFVDLNTEGALEKAITPKTKLVWMETPTNPLLKVVDITKVAAITKEHKITLVVDNTFLSPYNQQPLDLGADIVVHSVTKYINGHSDCVMGIACTNDEDLKNRLRFLQNGIGAVPSPFDSWLAMRGMKTLHIRMQRHGENALKIAKFLEGHEKVKKVIYPGLPSHPQYALAQKQMKTGGGMVTFILKGEMPESRQFLESIKLWKLAESLGSVESLVDHPAIMTHASIPKEEREKLGILDSLCRLSVGIEDVDDLIKDLDQALGCVSLKD